MADKDTSKPLADEDLDTVAGGVYVQEIPSGAEATGGKRLKPTGFEPITLERGVVFEPNDEE